MSTGHSLILDGGVAQFKVIKSYAVQGGNIVAQFMAHASDLPVQTLREHQFEGVFFGMFYFVNPGHFS